MGTIVPVPDRPASERLADQQYVVVLVRLLVGPTGHVVYGDVGGPEEHDPRVERWVHFRGLGGLTDAMASWLANRRVDD